MDSLTRRQLHALSTAFYRDRADAFDASRIDLPWPGWGPLAALLPERPIRVLDIGCGNGRLAADLRARGVAFETYVGTDASPELIEAARVRVTPLLDAPVVWHEQDFLAVEPAGANLPEGAFELVALMGVLHHVPGAESRAALIEAASSRVAPGGLLAVTIWQFADRPRFQRRRLDWGAVGDVLGSPIDPAALEPGDTLLRFGADPTAAPRYCHQVSEEERARWVGISGLETIADYQADGASGDLNRYWIARKSGERARLRSGSVSDRPSRPGPG
jgi:tRNA (uracil-5-)-methyltransferase TRM9